MKHAKEYRDRTEENLDEIGARLEHATEITDERRLAQETGISKSPAAAATKLLKLN
jgi:hypothetical protein